MGIQHDVEEGLDKYEVTTIKGQPTDEELNQLSKELTNAAGSVTTQDGGGEHGHVGMVVEEAEYILLPWKRPICHSCQPWTIPHSGRQ
jgi:hypothetical protein